MFQLRCEKNLWGCVGRVLANVNLGTVPAHQIISLQHGVRRSLRHNASLMEQYDPVSPQSCQIEIVKDDANMQFS